MKTARIAISTQGREDLLGPRATLGADQFVFLAGVPYRENLVLRIRHYTVPMEGLDFGTQLQWLGQQVS